MGKLTRSMVVLGIVTGAAAGSQLGHVTEMYGARAQAHKIEAVKVANESWGSFAEENGFQWDESSPVEGLEAISEHYTILAEHTADRLNVPLSKRDKEGIIKVTPEQEILDGITTELRKRDYQSVAGHLQTANATGYLSRRIDRLDHVVDAIDANQTNLLKRLQVVAKNYDREIMKETVQNYTPAITANNETLVGIGAGAAAGGIGFGVVGLMLSGLITAAGKYTIKNPDAYRRR